MKRRLFLTFGLMLFVGVASAQERERERSNRRVTYSFTDELQGAVDAPNVNLVIARANLTMDYDLALEESFLPIIVESVDNSPF